MTMPDPGDFHYSGDPGDSDLDEVRFALADVDPDVRLLSDTEISYLIGKWQPFGNGSNLFVASIACDVIIAKFAGVTRVEADGVSVDFTNLVPNYTALGARLRSLYALEQTGAEVDLTNIMWCATEDPSIAPLRFGVGVMDNPEAGLQDYGGEHSPWWTAELIRW